MRDKINKSGLLFCSLNAYIIKKKTLISEISVKNSKIYY
jgi:hypothetical protein